MIKNTKYLVLSYDDLCKYNDAGHITSQILKTVMGDILDYTELKNGDKRYYWYYVRIYNRQQRIFPSVYYKYLD